MLKRRIIPKLQLRSSKLSGRMVLVTTVNFEESIEIGDPVSQARIYEAQAVDELMFIDLDATPEGRPTMAQAVSRAAEEIFMPFCVGGGISTLEHIRTLLASGADKVSINTAAVQRPRFIREAADAFGSQCIVVSIDYRMTSVGNRVMINSGKQDTIREPVEWAEEAAELGAGEILLTSIDRDGTRQGLDVDTTRRVVDRVSIPVITSGGCGVAGHFIEGFQAGGAQAVAAGTFFCFQDQNPMQTRSHIRNAGIPIRLHR